MTVAESSTATATETVAQWLADYNGGLNPSWQSDADAERLLGALSAAGYVCVKLDAVSAEPHCLCGHSAEQHRRPHGLIAWWWGFDLTFGPRPCRGGFVSKTTPCACPSYRPFSIEDQNQ